MNCILFAFSIWSKTFSRQKLSSGIPKVEGDGPLRLATRRALPGQLRVQRRHIAKGEINLHKKVWKKSLIKPCLVKQRKCNQCTNKLIHSSLSWLSAGWLWCLPTWVWVDFDLDLTHLPCQFCLVPICLGRIRQTLEHLNPMQPNVGRRPPESPCILNLTNRRPTSSRRSGGWWRSWKWLKSAWWARRRGGTGPSPGRCWRWRTKSVR